MATKQQVDRAARKLGATIEWNREGCLADAPAGKIWDTSACHVIATWWEDPIWKAEALDGLLDEMAHGLHDCEDPDCDVCREELVDRT